MRNGLDFTQSHAARRSGIAARCGCKAGICDGSIDFSVWKHLELDGVAVSRDWNELHLVAANEGLVIGWKRGLEFWKCNEWVVLLVVVVTVTVTAVAIAQRRRGYLLSVVLSMLLLRTLIASFKLATMLMSSL
jgi:hypothetical protein